MKKFLLFIFFAFVNVLAVTENFTDNDGTALATHDANWTHVLGGGIAYAKIYSNALRLDGLEAEACSYNASARDTSQCVVKASMPQGANRNGPCVRMPADNYGYLIYLYAQSGGKWTSLYLTKNGSYLDLYTSLSYDTAADHTLKIIVSGAGIADTIKSYIDGTLIGTKIDASTPLAAGHPGIAMRNADDATNRIMIDTWRDGSSSCTPATVKPFGPITDTIGNSGKFADTITNAFDSAAWINAPPDSCVRLSAANDTSAFRWKIKSSQSAYTKRIYSCAGANTADAVVSITIIGPSLSYATSPRVDTIGAAATNQDPASIAMADSITAATLPTGLSIAKTGANMGRISGNVTTLFSKTGYKVVVWRKGFKSDSTYDSISSTYGIIYLDSIRPVSGYYNQGLSLYGRGFGATQGSSTLVMGDSTPPVVSWSNTKIDLTNKNISVDTFDVIITDGVTVGTITGGYVCLGKKQFTLTVATTGSGTSTPTTGLVDSGVVKAINNTPATRWGFKSWSVTGGATLGSSTTTKSNAVILSANGMVTALDTLIPHDSVAVLNDSTGIDTIKIDSALFTKDHAYTKPIICKYAHFTTSDSMTINKPLYVRDSVVYASTCRVGALAGSCIYPWVYPTNILTIKLNGKQGTPPILKPGYKTYIKWK
jgi:hypothetical protein